MGQRLIDANALCESPLYFVGDEVFVNIKAVENSPTIDAVPVVRCGDCKYCYAEGFVNVRNVCEKHYDFGNVDDDWFCADGERRSDEQIH